MKLPSRKTAGLIFSGLAIIGAGVTGILSAICTPKYKKIKEAEGGGVKTVAKSYYPALLAWLGTTISIILAEGLNLKEIAALGGVAAFLAKKVEVTQDAVREVYGEEALKEIKEKTDKECVKFIRSAGPSVEETGRGDLLIFDRFGGRLFRSSEVDVRNGVSKFLRDFDDGWTDITLSELYGYWGIMKTGFSNRWYWSNDPVDYDECPMVIEVEYFEPGTYEMIDGEMSKPVYNDEPMLVVDIETAPTDYYAFG